MVMIDVDMRGLVSLAAIVVALHGVSWGWLQESRPSNVPADAVFVRFDGGAVWQRCAIVPATGLVRCQIFEAKGRREHDESFFPYDEGPTLEASELTVAGDDPDAGPDWVCLENGRILMPGSRYDYVRSVLNKKLPKERRR